MKLCCRIICASLGFLIIVPPDIRAQSPVSSSSGTTSLQTYDVRPFDPNLVQLLANYHGVNPTTLQAKLSERKKSPQKDEFETTEQFHQRVQRVLAAPILGSLTTGSFMALEMDITAAYDADHELMQVDVVPSASQKVEFLEFEGKHFGASIKMGIPAAKKTKANLRALVLFKLQPPFLRESYTGQSRIVAQLFEVWFYSLSTGQVFVKKKAVDSTKPPPNPLLSESDKLYRDGRADEALATLRRLLRNDPMNADAYLLIGRINQSRGDLDAAISALRTAIFWESNLIDAHILLVRVFLEKGDKAKAVSHARLALQIDPKNPEAIKLQQQLELNKR